MQDFEIGLAGSPFVLLTGLLQRGHKDGYQNADDSVNNNRLKLSKFFSVFPTHDMTWATYPCVRDVEIQSQHETVNTTLSVAPFTLEAGSGFFPFLNAPLDLWQSRFVTIPSV